jgi:hypothetical protein
MHLRFNHPGVAADFGSHCDRFLGNGNNLTAWNRHTVFLQQGFGLVFVQIHSDQTLIKG